MLGLRSHSQLLHNSYSSSSSPVHLLSRSHIQTHSILIQRRVWCGAGKRAGGAGSPAKGGAAGQKQHSGKSNTQQGRPNIYENVPSTEGSAMQRMITSSISRIGNDSLTALQELTDIVDEWSSSFDFIHTSAAFTKAANLS
ncbi:hypothetical protein OEZ86_013865 [Tetradesmus obliquus]|nr:hypothetical protein OEZ86_013865 [Tetradesmus obliquus]